MTQNRKGQTVMEYLLNLKFLLIIGAIVAVLITAGCTTKNEKINYDERYWSEIALTNLLAHKAGLTENASGFGGGKGEFYYLKNGKDYLIKCESKLTNDGSIEDSCFEGEIIWLREYTDWQWAEEPINSFET